MNKENNKNVFNSRRMRTRSQSIDTRVLEKAHVEKKDVAKINKVSTNFDLPSAKLNVPNLTKDEIKIIQEQVLSTSTQKLETKIDYLADQIKGLGMLHQKLASQMDDIQKQLTLGHFTMQTALGMVLDRFKAIEQQIGEKSARFDKFQSDWLRKNDGMKRFLETIQGSVASISFDSQVFCEEIRTVLHDLGTSEIIRRICARVEHNDQRLVAALFEMFQTILEQQGIGNRALDNISVNVDAVTKSMNYVSKAVCFDWGLLTNIEDLRLNFNDMMRVVRDTVVSVFVT